MGERENLNDITNPVKNTEVSEIKRLSDFFHLTEQEEESLIKRIEQSNGLINIFVHPYLVSQEERAEVPSEILSMDEEIRKLALSDLDAVPPTLIMAEHDKVDIFRDQIAITITDSKILDQIQNNIYVIPTFIDDPSPIAGHSIYEVERDEDWSKMIDKLKSLGVKKIVIGGNRLFLDAPDHYPPGGCVGKTIRFLEKDFDLELSDHTSSGRAYSDEYERKRKILKDKLGKK